MERERRIREFIPHTGLISKVIPSQVMFKSFLDLEMPGRSRNGQSCEQNFTRVDNQSGYTRIFIPHEKIHATLNILERTGYHAENNFRGGGGGGRDALLWKI